MLPLTRLVPWLAALAAALVSAQAAADPPARVGRLSLIEGPVTFRIDREDPGSPAAANWPISSGAILDTDRGGRAEVWVGSTAYRLAGDSQIEFATVDDRMVSVNHTIGSLAVAIRHGDQADELEVRTPEAQIRFAGPGHFRIDTGEDGTLVTADDGTARVYGSDRTLDATPGNSVEVRDDGSVAVVDAPPEDAFDDWVASRDAASYARTARRYVSPAMTGYSDLDAYGSWGVVADYGTIWYPTVVPAGWAPYRYGRWAWIDPWGWTWIDAAPWGFAPFHYGRWLYLHGRWGWIPGTYVAHPVYAPAMVAWIGDPGWSLTVSVGSTPAVGWFPLAPREVYVPAYRVSTTYIRQVNVTHVTVRDPAAVARKTHPYRYREHSQAVTVVRPDALREGRPITRAAVLRHHREDVAKAPVSARAPADKWLAPSRTALHPGREGGGFRPDTHVAPRDRLKEGERDDLRRRESGTRQFPAVPARPEPDDRRERTREAPPPRDADSPLRIAPRRQESERPPAAEPPRRPQEEREHRLPGTIAPRESQPAAPIERQRERADRPGRPFPESVRPTPPTKRPEAGPPPRPAVAPPTREQRQQGARPEVREAPRHREERRENRSPAMAPLRDAQPAAPIERQRERADRPGRPFPESVRPAPPLMRPEAGPPTRPAVAPPARERRQEGPRPDLREPFSRSPEAARPGARPPQAREMRRVEKQAPAVRQQGTPDERKVRPQEERRRERDARHPGDPQPAPHRG